MYIDKKMHQEIKWRQNIPDNNKLKKLLKENYGEDFPKIYNTRDIPLIALHFDAKTPKEMVEKGLVDELIILLQYMIGEKTTEDIKSISHKLGNILNETH